MKNLAVTRIQKMDPYLPPLDGRSTFDGDLLDFNERTTCASLELANGARLNLYPEYFDLVDQIANYVGVNADQILVTNGTDQAIDVIFRTFSDRGDRVIVPEPTFAMYRQYALVNGNEIDSPLYESRPLNYPVQQVLESIRDNTKIVVVCNPNNPTGTEIAIEQIASIAGQAQDQIIYVDEAYFEFSRCSAVELIEQYPNIVVTRTFSKAFGLAAMRIGYVVANSAYIAEMMKVRGPYDVNTIAASMASAVLSDLPSMQTYVQEVMQVAKPTVEQFFDEIGVQYFASAANFVLFKSDLPLRDALVLQNNGIRVRPQFKPVVGNALRVTIGTAKQAERFIDVYANRLVPQKVALLDRDGTLIFEPQDTFQIDSLAKYSLLDGVIEGLQQLRDAHFKLVMVTNQDGLGTQSFPQQGFDEAHDALLAELRVHGIKFDEILICPHPPEDGCMCRKPKMGLLQDWLSRTNVDLARSFVCGDRQSDQQLADNLGLEYLEVSTNGEFGATVKGYLEKQNVA